MNRREFVKTGACAAAAISSMGCVVGSNSVTEDVLVSAVLQAGRVPNCGIGEAAWSEAERRYKNSVGLWQLIADAAEANGLRAKPSTMNVDCLAAAWCGPVVKLENVIEASVDALMTHGFCDMGENTWRLLARIVRVDDMHPVNVSGTAFPMQTRGSVYRLNFSKDDIGELLLFKKIGYGAKLQFNKDFWKQMPEPSRRQNGDANHVLYRASRQVVEMFGWSKDTPIRKQVDVILPAYPGDPERLTFFEAVRIAGVEIELNRTRHMPDGAMIAKPMHMGPNAEPVDVAFLLGRSSPTVSDVDVCADAKSLVSQVRVFFGYGINWNRDRFCWGNDLETKQCLFVTPKKSVATS